MFFTNIKFKKSHKNTYRREAVSMYSLFIIFFPIGYIKSTYKNAGEKPYKCSHCPSKFAHSSYLKHHIKTHTRENMYKCSHSSSIFTNSSSLKHHIKHIQEKICINVLIVLQFFRIITFNKTYKKHIITHIKTHKCHKCSSVF